MRQTQPRPGFTPACSFALDPIWLGKAGEPNPPCLSHVQWAFSHVAERGSQGKERGPGQADDEQKSTLPKSTYKPRQRLPPGTLDACELCCAGSSLESGKQCRLMFLILCHRGPVCFTHALVQRAAGTHQNPRTHASFPFMKAPWPGKAKHQHRNSQIRLKPLKALKPAPI